MRRRNQPQKHTINQNSKKSKCKWILVFGNWHKVAAISGIPGAVAVGLGAYGAHGFKPNNPSYKQVWNTASLYHLVHTAALLAAPTAKYPNIFGGFLSAGILLFSGTCYTVAYTEDRSFNKLAPIGGFAFIAGWASLLF